MTWFVEKRIYLPSWPLALMLLPLPVIIVIGFVFGVVPFLAVDQRLDTTQWKEDEILLVVEGWVQDHVIEEAVRMYRTGEYAEIAATGGPVTETGHLLQVATFAEYGARRLIAAGIPEDKVIIAPAYSVDRRRTQRAAIDLCRDLDKREKHPRAINLVTADVHARRSRLIFRRVFGENVEIGINGVEPKDYDSGSWWKTSAGMKTVIIECISLLYDTFSPTSV